MFSFLFVILENTPRSYCVILRHMGSNYDFHKNWSNYTLKWSSWQKLSKETCKRSFWVEKGRKCFKKRCFEVIQGHPRSKLPKILIRSEYCIKVQILNQHDLQIRSKYSTDQSMKSLIESINKIWRSYLIRNRVGRLS